MEKSFPLPSSSSPTPSNSPRPQDGNVLGLVGRTFSPFLYLSSHQGRNAPDTRNIKGMKLPFFLFLPFSLFGPPFR